MDLPEYGIANCNSVSTTAGSLALEGNFSPSIFHPGSAIAQTVWLI
jgi:hypothetical protein